MPLLGVCGGRQGRLVFALFAGREGSQSAPGTPELLAKGPPLAPALGKSSPMPGMPPADMVALATGPAGPPAPTAPEQKHFSHTGGTSSFRAAYFKAIDAGHTFQHMFLDRYVSMIWYGKSDR